MSVADFDPTEQVPMVRYVLTWQTPDGKQFQERLTSEAPVIGHDTALEFHQRIVELGERVFGLALISWKKIEVMEVEVRQDQIGRQVREQVRLRRVK